MKYICTALFGKHPAWPDHIFVSPAPDIGSKVKTVFYDKSVVDAVRDVVASELEKFVYIYEVDSHLVVLVLRPSSDQLGRSRYPLCSACYFERETGECLSSGSLEQVTRQLDELLDAVLITDKNPDSEEWRRKVVERLAGLEISLPEERAINWLSKSIVEDNQNFALVEKLYLALSEGVLSFRMDAMNLHLASTLSTIARMQYKRPAPSLLAIDKNSGFRPDRLLLTGVEGLSFNLASLLDSRLEGLSEMHVEGNEKARSIVEGDSLIGAEAISDFPRLGISNEEGPSLQLFQNRKILIFGGAVAALIILFGLILATCSSSPEEQAEPAVTHTKSIKDEVWQRYSGDYLAWVKPTLPVVEKAAELKLLSNTFPQENLNPFSVVNLPENQRFSERPPRRIRSAESQEGLTVVYQNIDALRQAVVELNSALSLDPEMQTITNWGLEATGIVFSDQAEISFDRDTDDRLTRKIDKKRFMQDLVTGIRPLQEKSLASIPDNFPQLKSAALAYLQDQLNRITWESNLLDFSESWNNLTPENWSWDFSDIRMELLASELARAPIESGNKEELLQKLMQRTQDFRTVEQSGFEVLLQTFQRKSQTLEQKVDAILNDFSEIDGKKYYARLGDLSSKASLLTQYEPVSGELREAEKEADALMQQLLTVNKDIQDEVDELTQPDRWIPLLEPQYAAFKHQTSRQFAERYLINLKDGLLAKSRGQNIPVVFRKFKTEAMELIELAARIDRSIEGTESHKTLLALYNNDSSLVDGMLSSIISGLLNSGELDSIEAIDRHYRAVMNSEISGIQDFALRVENFTRLYESRDKSRLRSLKAVLSNILDSRYFQKTLLDGQVFHRSRYLSEILLSKNEKPAFQDIYWYSLNRLDNADSPWKEIMPELADAVASMELDTVMVEAYQPVYQHALKKFLSKYSPADTIRLFSDLSLYKPVALWDIKDRYLNELALFYKEISDVNRDKDTLLKLIEKRHQNRASLLVSFYGDQLRASQNLGNISFEDGLRQFVEERPLLTRYEVNADRSVIRLLFEEPAGIVPFQRIEVFGGSQYYIQTREFSVQQFWTLVVKLGLSTDQWAENVPYIYPRAYNTAPDGKPVYTGYWLIGGREWPNIPGFESLETTANHLNQPGMVLDFARKLGFELPGKIQAETLFAQYKPGPLQPDLPSESLWQIINFFTNTMEDSVYSPYIKSLNEDKGWKGGLYYHHTDEGNPFESLWGGAAELVYDSGQKSFSAFGGSYLYSDNPGELIPLKNPSMFYNDLGFRLVFHSPQLSLLEQVKKNAEMAFSKKLIEALQIIN